VEDIRKGDPVTISRKLRRSGKGVVLSIPKDIVELMSLDDDTVVEATIRKVTRVVVLDKETVKR
jgi:hypothetical protein